MRFLHTSDWHLGQNFMGKSRLPEHRAFFAWLLEQVKLHQISAIIVAGDIFDTGTPPSYARELYNQLVIDLHQLDCQLIVLAGNHDSVAVLNESKGLLAQLSASVIAQPQADLSDQLVLLSQKNQPFALVAAIPFLRPRDIVLSQAGESSTEKKQSLQQAISEHYQTLFASAKNFLKQQNLQLPIILTGHLTTLGASISESVRDIYVGNLESFPADAFPPADYIALGHIHRPQLVAGQQHVRYSGSPIALSFDEVGRIKQVVLVECQADQVSAIVELDVPIFQQLIRLAGNLKEIEQQLQPLVGAEQNAWLEIEVQEDDYLDNLHQRLHSLCEGLPVEVLRIKRKRQSVASLSAEFEDENLSELTVHEVFERRLAQEALDKQQQQQLLALHQSVIEQLQDPERAHADAQQRLALSHSTQEQN